MGLFDYFVAAMPCPHCRVVCPADGSTRMNTKLLDDAYQRPIAVGFVFEEYDVSAQNILDSGYEATGNPRPDGKLRLVHDWQCPSCLEGHLAQVTVDDSTLVAIEPLPWSVASTAQAQYVHHRTARYLAAERKS